MNGIIALLPASLQAKAKSIVATVGAIAAIVVQVATSLPADVQLKISGAIAIVSAVLVYLQPNGAGVAGEVPQDDFTDDAPVEDDVTTDTGE